MARLIRDMRKERKTQRSDSNCDMSQNANTESKSFIWAITAMDEDELDSLVETKVLDGAISKPASFDKLKNILKMCGLI